MLSRLTCTVPATFHTHDIQLNRFQTFLLLTADLQADNQQPQSVSWGESITPDSVHMQGFATKSWTSLIPSLVQPCQAKAAGTQRHHHRRRQ